jgi:hypothetical protein
MQTTPLPMKLVSLCALLLMFGGCSPEQEFTAPPMVDKNPVRPDVIVEPVPEGATNQQMTNRAKLP